MSDDYGHRITRVEERQERDREMINRLERNAEKTDVAVQSLSLSVNKLIWTLGALTLLSTASQMGILPALAKLVWGLP